MATNIAAVAEQTRKGLSSSRRAGGRIVTPFLKTLPGQGRMPADVRARGRIAATARTEPDVGLTASGDQDERWGA